MDTRGMAFGLAMLGALIAAASGQDRPGDRRVSTAVPAISVQTSVPAEINLGSTTQVVIVVKNAGKALAEGVSIQTTLPATVKFVGATPVPSLASERVIQFEIGDLAAGAERRLTVDLIPQKHGPVDLQTKTFFSASMQSALQVRRPEIAIRCQGPDEVVVGETVTFRVIVENTGDGAAQDVVLTPSLPTGSHVATQVPAAAKMAVLAAGEAKEYRFVAQAADGQWLDADFVASARDGQEVHCGKRVKILRPELKVEIKGTRVSFMKMEARYEIRVWNPGDTVLSGGMVGLAIPEGLQLTAISEEARTDTAKRTLTWCLPVMNPGASQSLMLKATATRTGAQLQKVVATCSQLVAKDDHLTLVIARPNVEVAVSNKVEAIEVGAAESFTIVVKNNGSKAAEQVDVQALIPESLTAVPSAEHTIAGQQVTFPRTKLAPGEEKTLRFQASSLTAGEHAVRATVRTESASLPTIAETTVYFFDEAELEQVARQSETATRVR